jgi:hypothetical protein
MMLQLVLQIDQMVKPVVLGILVMLLLDVIMYVTVRLLIIIEQALVVVLQLVLQIDQMVKPVVLGILVMLLLDVIMYVTVRLLIIIEQL